MKRWPWLFTFGFAAVVMVATVHAQPPPVVDAHNRLTSAGGLTLYTYDEDNANGQSHCDGPCAALWPPYVADAGAQAHAGFGLVTRADHSPQWSYMGHPLYRYAGDTAPGMALGDGMNGNWHVARAH